AILAPPVEVFVLKPELGEIVVVSRAGVDPPYIELPITGINGALNGYAIAYFPTKPLGDSRSSDCAFAIFQECLPFCIGDYKLRKHHSLIFGVDRELGEKVFFVLINAAKPVVVRDGFHARNSKDLVTVRIGERLNNRDLVNHVKPVRTRDIHSLAERTTDDDKDAKKKHGHSE